MQIRELDIYRSNMEKVYKAFKERQARKRKAVIIFISTLIIEVITFICADYVGIDWLSGFFAFLFGVTLLGGFFYLGSRPWMSESIEMKIFVNLYEAIDMLETYSKSKEKVCLKKAVKFIQKAINSIRRFIENSTSVRCSLFHKEIVSNFEKLKASFQNRILPRVSSAKNLEVSINLLRDIANTFGRPEQEIDLNSLVSINQQLEKFKPIELKPEPSFITKIKQTTAGRILYSLTLGYLLILIICFVYATGTNQIFATFIRENPEIVIIGGLIASGIAFYKA